MNSEEKLLTKEQLAQQLQLKPSAIYELTRAARGRSKNPDELRPVLPCIKVGKYLRFSPSEVEQWLNDVKGHSMKMKLDIDDCTLISLEEVPESASRVDPNSLTGKLRSLPLGKAWAIKTAKNPYAIQPSIYQQARRLGFRVKTRIVNKTLYVWKEEGGVA